MRTEMNKKENLKTSVIECCINGTMTVKVAADRLGFSERYVKKLKARYKKLGPSSMMHGNCGRQPKHTIDAETKSKIIEIWKQPEYEECNFKHFQEFFKEDYNITISQQLYIIYYIKKDIKAPESTKKLKYIIDVKNVLQQVNFYKLMVYHFNSFMETIKCIVYMVL